MKLSIKAGATSETIDLFIQDKTKTDGSGLTGLVFNSAGLTCYYNFPRGNSVAVTLATLAAPNSAWSSGGFKEIDATNEPGHFRFDIPNAALASGNGRYVKLVLRGAASMADLALEIELTGWDNQDGVRGGLTAIPSAAVGSGANSFNFDSAGYIQSDPQKWLGGVIPAVNVAGVPLVDVSYWRGTQPTLLNNQLVRADVQRWLNGVPPAVNVTGVPIVDLNYTRGTASTGAPGYVGIDWSQINAPTTVVALSGTTIGTLTTYTGNTPQTGDCFARLGAPAGASIAADLAEIEGETDSLLAGVIVTTNNDKNGYSLLATGLNLVLVDGKTLPAAVQYIAAAACGKVSGAGSGTETFLGLDAVTTRLTITVDSVGNRTAITYG